MLVLVVATQDGDTTGIQTSGRDSQLVAQANAVCRLIHIELQEINAHLADVRIPNLDREGTVRGRCVRVGVCRVHEVGDFVRGDLIAGAVDGAASTVPFGTRCASSSAECFTFQIRVADSGLVRRIQTLIIGELDHMKETWPINRRTDQLCEGAEC